MRYPLGSVWRSVGIVLWSWPARTGHIRRREWTVTDLGTLGGLFGDANDINDAGHAVGESTSRASTTRFYGRPRAEWSVSAHWAACGAGVAINNAGQVVGFADDAFGERAFLWTAAGGMINLGYLGEIFPGFAFSGASDINQAGQVVGVSTTASGSHAFLWTASGGMVDLGTLGGPNSSARAINDAGQIVGGSDTASGEEHAFLWTAAGGMVDLGTWAASPAARSISTRLGRWSAGPPRQAATSMRSCGRRRAAWSISARWRRGLEEPGGGH